MMITPDEAQAILTDAQALGEMYRMFTLTELAAILGVSAYIVRHSLLNLGLQTRKRGKSPPDRHKAKTWRLVAETGRPEYLIEATPRDTVRIRSWRTYLLAERCPLDCPRRDGCDGYTCALSAEMVDAKILRRDYARSADAQRLFHASIAHLTGGRNGTHALRL